MKKILSLFLICILTVAGCFALTGCKDKKENLVTVATHNGIKYELLETVVTNNYRFTTQHENYYTVVVRIRLTNITPEDIISNSGDFRIKSHSQYALNNEGILKGMPDFIDTTPSKGTVPATKTVNFNMTMNLMPLTQLGQALNAEAQKKFLQDCNDKLETATFTLYINNEKLIDFKIKI